MTLPMDGGDAASFLDVDTTQELGDTKHKAVTYVAEATTRFAEYFTHRTTVTVVHGADHAVVLAAAGVAPKVRVRSLDPADRRTWSDSGKRPSWTVDAAAGKVSFHAYPSVADGAPDPTIPAGTQVEVAFVALPLSRLSVTPVALDIRASSRPAAPDVALLVPTFAWTQTRTPRDTHAPTAQITSRRDAATLRVYLRRPWWTSGAGEQLAIVLYPGGVDGDSSEVPDALVPYVTQWGADPAYAAAPPPAPLPSFAAFPQAVSTHRGLFLDELPQSGATPDSKVDVAVHEVSYDESQDLWYCDVRVDAGHAYQPFVRLALARFQPHALSVQESGIKRDDLHLSRVVIADFVQLAPERVATVTWTPTGTRVTVQLAGPTYKATASEQRPAPMPAVGGPGPGYATVAIESRLPGVSDTDVGWSPVGTPRSMRVTPDASWITEFDLPGAPGGTGQFRLVIEQGDLFAHDPGNSPPGPVSSGTLDSGGRLVHSDVIVL
jgi:hypothetical protein